MLSSFPHLEGHPQFQMLKMLLTTIYNAEEDIKKQNALLPNVDNIFEKSSEHFEETMDRIE
jgi:hypothetical protein